MTRNGGIHTGLVRTAIAALYALWVTGAAIAGGVETPGYVLLLAGEYLGRIRYESERRPHFLIKETNVPRETFHGAGRGWAVGRLAAGHRARGGNGAFPLMRAQLFQFVRFGVIGVVNTGTFYVLYLLLHSWLPYYPAYVLAFLAAMVGSFFLNTYFTYRTKPTWRKFLLFPLTNLTNFIVTSVGVFVLVEWFGVDERIAPLAAAVAAIPVTFVLSRRILTHRDTPAGVS